MDGRWAGLSHLSSAAHVPQHPTYGDLLAQAPAEPRADLPIDPSARQGEGSGLKEDEYYIYHQVEPRDTLMGLSLRYRISTDILKRENNLPTENLATVKTIRIPKANARPRTVSLGVETTVDAKIRRLKSEGCSTEEARLYLDESGGDVEMAIAQYRDDLEQDRRAGVSTAQVEAAVAASSVVVKASSLIPPVVNEALAGFPSGLQGAGSGGSRLGGRERGWSKKDEEEEDGEGESLIGSQPAHVSNKKLPSPSGEDEGVASGIALTTFDAFVNGGGSTSGTGTSAGGAGERELRRRTTAGGQPTSSS